MSKSIFITITVAIVVGAAAFFGGMQYQKSQANNAGTQLTQRFGQAGARFGGRGGMATIGKVVTADNNSITIQLSDGSSKIVNFSASTRIVKTETATASDVTSGTMIAVFGTTNSDGSVTAQNIQINPTNMFRGQRPSGTPTQ